MAGSISALLAAGWIPFVVFVVLIIIFSWLYIIKYRSRRDSECSTTTVSIIGLSITLLTCALIPVDVFTVSYMKKADGTFKDWASSSEERKSVQNDVLYTYYTTYAVIMFMAFFVIPFQYFYYEEGDEGSSRSSRFCGAFKYTVIFIIGATVLLVVGALIPLKDAPPTNSTEYEKVKFIFSQLGNNRGMDALSFVLNVMCLIGMLCMIIYTGYGMASWPIGLLRGALRAKNEHVQVVAERSSVSSRINAIRSKYSDGRRRITDRDLSDLSNLEENNRLLDRQEKYLHTRVKSIIQKCHPCLRPFQIVFGVFIMLVGLLILVSLMLSNIDKAMHSLGYTTGYTLPKRTIFNPIDYILVKAEKVYPLDYILYVSMVSFFLFATMSGLRNLGIWFLWIQMYKIRPRRTRPQGLLLAVFTLVFVILAINVTVFSLSPLYTMYGNQHYREIVNKTSHGNSSDFGGDTSVSYVIKQCTTEAPPDECLMTRMSMLLTRFFYKAWFFGAVYYWGTWVFLSVTCVGSLIALYVGRKSSIDGLVDESDLEESDDDDLIRA